jgi:uncharacterized membrane protein YoaK (UPF0700 family)
MKKSIATVLLSFNGGFIDTAGYLGLQGLFTAHVTGNFVTLGATLVFGTNGVIAKIVALPEFIVVVAITRLVAATLTERRLPSLRVLLAAKVFLLFAFFSLAVTLGPFPDSDAPVALLTGFTAIAAMAIQNSAQRVYFNERLIGTLRRECLDHVLIFVVRVLKRQSIVPVRLIDRMAPAWSGGALGQGLWWDKDATRICNAAAG